MNTRSILRTLMLVSALMGASACATEEADLETSGDELTARRTDAQIKAALERVIRGYNVTFRGNEGDSEFRYISATPRPGETINATSLRRMFADVVEADPEADKPLSALYYDDMSFAEWKRRAAGNPDDGFPADTELQAINKVLSDNLTGIKIYYYGRNGRRGVNRTVEGINASVFVVGKTPSGKIAGLYTVVTWT